MIIALTFIPQEYFYRRGILVLKKKEFEVLCTRPLHFYRQKLCKVILAYLKNLFSWTDLWIWRDSEFWFPIQFLCFRVARLAASSLNFALALVFQLEPARGLYLCPVLGGGYVKLAFFAIPYGDPSLEAPETFVRHAITGYQQQGHAWAPLEIVIFQAFTVLKLLKGKNWNLLR